MDDGRQHAAYLGARLPATYAAVSATLRMVPAELGDSIRSLLDLGAGPGTATWAAHAHCGHLTEAMQADRSRPLLDVAARLAASAGIDRDITLTQQVADVAAPAKWPAADLVIAAYALSELSAAGRAALARSAWAASSQLCVFVEPGTPDGFSRVLDVRTLLLANGAHMVAPCPHAGQCPMVARPHDWCHFAVRLPRTRLHRQIKGGSLGYEDEKFSCLVVARAPSSPAARARILRHPRMSKGRIDLLLCTRDGARDATVTRRDVAWRAARKADWGDSF